jgi:hypothetical protein
MSEPKSPITSLSGFSGRLPESVWQALRKPFKQGDITFVPIARDSSMSCGICLAAPRASSVYKRLNDVLGPEGWSLTFSQVQTLYTCRLRIGRSVREGHSRFTYDEKSSRDLALLEALSGYGILSEMYDKGPMLLRIHGGKIVDMDDVAEKLVALGAIES